MLYFLNINLSLRNNKIYKYFPDSNKKILTYNYIYQEINLKNCYFKKY